MPCEWKERKVTALPNQIICDNCMSCVDEMCIRDRSWLVLAKPHSYVHVGWAQSTFFMPFLLLLPAYWVLAGKDVLSFVREKQSRP